MHPLEHEDFRRDLEIALEGDTAAASRVGLALAPRIEGMLRVRLSGRRVSWDLLEDLRQEVQLALCGRLPELRGENPVAALKAWLSAVVRNKVADLLRRPGLPRAVFSGWAVNPLSASDVLRSVQALQASNTSPSSHLHRAQLFEEVMASMAELPERRREALTLAFIDELDSTEIGAALGCSRQAAAMLVLRSLRSLRDHWLREERANG